MLHVEVFYDVFCSLCSATGMLTSIAYALTQLFV